MFFDITACLVQSPPSTLPHFKNSETFFPIKILSIDLALSFLIQRWVFSPLRNSRTSSQGQSDKSNPIFWTQCCNKNKTHQYWGSQISSVSLLNRSFHFYHLVLFVEKRVWSGYRAAVLVLSRCESTCLWIEISTRKKTSRHGLAHRTWI